MGWIRPKLIHCFSIFCIIFNLFSLSLHLTRCPPPPPHRLWPYLTHSIKPETEYKERKGKEGRKGMREAIRNILTTMLFFLPRGAVTKSRAPDDSISVAWPYLRKSSHTWVIVLSLTDWGWGAAAAEGQFQGHNSSFKSLSSHYYFSRMEFFVWLYHAN